MKYDWANFCAEDYRRLGLPVPSWFTEDGDDENKEYHERSDEYYESLTRYDTFKSTLSAG